MDNLFTWFDSFFDEVITNVNDVPLTNFIIDRQFNDTSNQTNSTQPGFSYTMLSTSSEFNELEDLGHVEEDEHNYDNYLNSHNFHSLEEENEIHTGGIENDIIQNANRLRVLQELYTQTVSNSLDSQNLDYTYNINSQRAIHVPSVPGLPSLDIYTPPSIEIPSQITDLFTLFFNNQIINTLDSLEDVKVTLDQSIFDKLPLIVFPDCNHKIEEPCNICMEDYIDGDILKQLPCNHYYHKDCISQWLCNEKTTCPMCRKDVRSAFETEINENNDNTINIDSDID